MKLIYMKNITVIIPLQDYLKDTFGKAVKSVPADIDTIMVVGSSEMIKDVKKDIKEDGRVQYIAEEKQDLASLLNRGIENCTSEYFAILGADDEFTDIWEKNADEYMKSKTYASVFLPMIMIEDVNTKSVAGLGNELAWASAFCQEIGEIDNECLKSYMGFYINGGIFKTDDVKEVGGLKPSFKIVSTYEFLLRLTYNSKRVIVIPKIGCKHTFGFEKANEEKISQEEMDWLIKTAQKEMFFKEDRGIKFEKKEE